jgi:hypothetical protein
MTHSRDVRLSGGAAIWIPRCLIAQVHYAALRDSSTLRLSRTGKRDITVG